MKKRRGKGRRKEGKGGKGAERGTGYGKGNGRQGEGKKSGKYRHSRVMKKTSSYEHSDAGNTSVLKQFPLVCKALYDMDVIDEENFLPYYADSKANKGNPGHDVVHKVLKSFVEWLKDNSSSDDSDSD